MFSFINHLFSIQVKQYQNKAFLLENEMTSLKRKLELMDNENKRLKSDVSSKMYHYISKNIIIL